MNISENGINLIKSFEGLRLKAYKPVKTEKYWTIGYGHYGADVKEDDVITMAKALELLRKDIAKFEKGVNDLKRPFNQNQFDALVSFAYNCGNGNLKKLCKDRTDQQIADKMLEFNHSGKTVLPGLTRRRQTERMLFLTLPTSSSSVQPNSKPSVQKSEYQVAIEVLAGRYGMGEERKLNLTRLGYGYNAVQSVVNKLCKGQLVKPLDEVAKEVIEGYWMTGVKRQILLEKCGYNYNAVQKRVNEMLKG